MIYLKYIYNIKRVDNFYHDNINDLKTYWLHYLSIVINSDLNKCNFF